jgi:hypothetical protein
VFDLSSGTGEAMVWTLEELRHHWSGAYRFEHRRGRWTAQRRDDGHVLEADEPEQLLAVIREDYRRRPVSRDAACLRVD